MSLEKTPVTVITGFLGAGKTTLIRHLLQNPGGRRLAVLVNEFGDVGVDGDLIRDCADANCPEANILELTNGCICCTVADEFIPSIEKLMALDPRPDHIVIETSGLALPKPLLKAFDWPDLRSKITIDGVVAVADAEAVAAGLFAPDPAHPGTEADHETPLSEVFEDQIACADIVLLSKADLAGEAGLAKAREVIATDAPRALPMLPLTEGVIDARVVLGIGAAAEDSLDARPSHHDGHDDHDHDDFDTVVVDLPEQTDPEALAARVAALAASQNILRVKGHVAVEGRPMRLLIQAVGSRVRHQFDRPWGTAPRRSQLVVIAEKGNVDAAAVKAALA
ncbi:cobalamin biosynthesis protein CobW [Pseudogemmobacter humi]|uniref:Putative GTP-binding protein YjiA n=1 Tax=Pseudogemmobacter humi TaxID=2483812 RepID=A0A3P5X012_9RHOB|nr:cobalamin biosynthesis protein CobW [Pseudogemmobacter humi]VDC21199.1 putative GTP-binding protein YjiA [Pseudogemmobacter humi]